MAPGHPYAEIAIALDRAVCTVPLVVVSPPNMSGISGGGTDWPKASRAPVQGSGMVQVPVVQQKVEQEMLCVSGLFTPKSNRSLGSRGLYTAPSSAINVPLTPQISMSRYQSLLLRASRDASSMSTIPTFPKTTSAAKRWNPVRCAAVLPERP